MFGLTMATQKQIEANRRNARNSTGPRSASGKKRASRNAFSHGLSRPMLGAEFARAVEALASRILGEHGRANDRHALARPDSRLPASNASRLR